MGKIVKLFYSLIAIICAITLSSYISTNNGDIKLKKDSTVTYKLQIKSQPIITSAISLDKDLQTQMKNSLSLFDSVNKSKLGILQETSKIIETVNPSILERIIGYYGYTEEDIIAKARGDTIIRGLIYWILLLLFITHLYYLTGSSPINKENEWKSSLIHFIIMIGSYPLIYYCLYYLLSGLFNSDYITIQNIITNFK